MKNCTYLLTLTLFTLLISPASSLETDEGYLLEGRQTDYSRYSNSVYTPQVEKLRGTVVDGSKVFLFWEKIPHTNVTYTILRNTRPLDTYSSIKSATVVARVTDENRILDTTIERNGSYYYAITTKKKKMREDLQLKRDKSFLDRPFIIGSSDSAPSQRHRPGKTQQTVRNLEIHENDSSLTLQWDSPGDFTGHTIIYASDHPFTGSESVRQSRVIARLQGTDSYTLRPKPQKTVYYCLLLEKNGTLYYYFNNDDNCALYSASGRNTISGSVTPDSPSSEQGDTPEEDRSYHDDIDRIVRDIYRTDNYALLEKKLRRIARLTTSRKIRARAAYFVGRIQVEKHEYRRALTFFYRPDVQKYYKEESQFWQDYCLSQL